MNRTFLILFGMLTGAVAFAQPAAPRGDIVEITVTYQTYDPLQPWQLRPPAVRTGYGVFLDGTRVLTTEDLTRAHTLIELRKARSGARFAARVVLDDVQLNLALLEVRDPAFFKDTPPMRVCETVPADAALQALQFDEASEVQSREAHIVRAEVAPLPSAPYSILSFEVLTDLNVTRSPVVVLHEGALAGLLMSYDRTSRTGRLLPYPVIRRFLENAAATPYAGSAIAGFGLKPLIDPATRAYLNVTNQGQGVLITSVIPGTGAAAVLKPNDVILRWDGVPISDLALYDDPAFGRLALSYLIKGRRKPGDVVPITVVSDRVTRDLNVTLSGNSDASALIPQNTTGRRPSYIVEGGLILRELDGEYLRSFGDEWQSRVDSRLVYLYNTRATAPAKPGQRVVILSSVLPDAINLGYQQLFNVIIEGVNGHPIDNMEDVFKIALTDGALYRFDITASAIDLALDREKIQEANTRLAKTYRIRDLRYRAR